MTRSRLQLSNFALSPRTTESRGPEEFGLQRMRAATMPEIEAAGLGALVRAQHGDDEFDLE